MDRNPFDEPQHGAPPPPSGPRPSRTGAAVPPPPPPPARASQRSLARTAPPTAQPSRPPTTENPPRPGLFAPPPTGGDAPPLGPPPPGSWVEPTGSRPGGRRRRKIAAVVGGVLVALSLVSGGIVIGSALTDDVTTVAPTRVDDSVRSASSDGEGDTAPLEVVPGPLAGEDSDEPVADVAEAVAPSVVLIQADEGQGSGIVWDAANGYIVTNDHVIGDASSVIVQFANGARVNGTVLGGDSARDIAVVEVDPTGAELTEAEFTSVTSVEVGQLAVAIGSPFGLDQSVTAGIVSAVNRINSFGGSDPSNPVDVEMIQTDAPINPGNSGGALADREGRVIGMNTQIRTSGQSNGNVGVGFAVPSDTIVLIAQRIVDGESLELAYLGVSGDTPRDGTVGALIQSVVIDAPAAEAGLQAGDLIVAFDGEEVRSMAELSADVKLFRPGDQAEIEFIRDGERLQSVVTLDSP